MSAMKLFTLVNNHNSVAIMTRMAIHRKFVEFIKYDIAWLCFVPFEKQVLAFGSLQYLYTYRPRATEEDVVKRMPEFEFILIS